MIELKHLKTGSEMPALPTDGKLQLYTMRFCPYAQRIHLILDAKNIPHQFINVDLAEKPEWLKKINPFNKVPVLMLTNEPGTPAIYESLLIAEYLEEKYPQNPLYPKDLLARIQEKLWIERFNNVITPLGRLFYGVESSPGTITEIVNELDLFETELKRRGTPYFGGTTPGILDYMIWPWCERTDTLKYLIGDKYELDKDRFPKLIEWRTLMKENAVVKITYLSGEVHANFMKGKRAGCPNSDLLLNDSKRPRLH